MRQTTFKTLHGQTLPMPIFFPDATRAVVKTLDSEDVKNTFTPGVLVNTYHLYNQLGKNVLKSHKGIRKFMNWDGAIISDSGGFQIMSIAKTGFPRGKVTDKGVTFSVNKSKKVLFTPEASIQYQMLLETDLMVVLDDFTEQGCSYEVARETVDRTILWAKRCREEFDRICKQKGLNKDNRPYLIGVVQGGEYLDLRKECTEKLVEIGFDGLGYGGWPIDASGNFNYEVAKVIADNSPSDYILYGLGIGKPQEVVGCFDLGYTIFDCVLPSRDARHKRLYVYNAKEIDDINIRSEKFYSYFSPDKEKYYNDNSPVSTACDCLLCTKYTKAYLAHLFRIQDLSALRLASIHNLRFYSILMEKLRE